MLQMVLLQVVKLQVLKLFLKNMVYNFYLQVCFIDTLVIKLIKNKPKNKISFLKKRFKNLNLKKLNNKLLHSPEISAHTSIIAKEQKIRNILKIFQKNLLKNLIKFVLKEEIFRHCYFTKS